MKAELEQALSKFRTEGAEVGAAQFALLMQTYPSKQDEILRERSCAYAESQAFEEALSDRRAILDMGRGTPGDSYFGGEYALQAGQFEVARTLFDETIRASLETGSNFYLQSSRLLAALASYQLNDDEASWRYLQLIDDEVEVLWLKGFNRVTKQMVIDAMNHQA